MASSLIRNQVPRKGLRVRVPCPPLVFVAEFAPSGPGDGGCRPWHRRWHPRAIRSILGPVGAGSLTALAITPVHVSRYCYNTAAKCRACSHLCNTAKALDKVED